MKHGSVQSSVQSAQKSLQAAREAAIREEVAFQESNRGFLARQSNAQSSGLGEQDRRQNRGQPQFDPQSDSPGKELDAKLDLAGSKKVNHVVKEALAIVKEEKDNTKAVGVEAPPQKHKKKNAKRTMKSNAAKRLKERAKKRKVQREKAQARVQTVQQMVEARTAANIRIKSDRESGAEERHSKQQKSSEADSSQEE